MINIMPVFILFLIIIFFKLRNSLNMLQQNLYNENNRYIKWIFKHFKKLFLSHDLIIIIFIPVMFFINNTSINMLLLSVLFIYLIYFYRNESIKQKKVEKIKFVVTNRIKRLITTIIVLIFIILFILFNFDFNLKIVYLTFILISYFIYFISYIANIINIPIEKLVYLSYKTKAQNRLKSFNNLKVIGITGSYGKTSSKNILNDILSAKYNVCPSPKNWNTPYGLIRAILNYVDKFDDFFIAEMGAYKKGEIKKIAKLVKPSYGIITKIGTAHLESFGSEENIMLGKFELYEAISKDGAIVLNKDDDKQELYVNKYAKNRPKILWIGINNKTADFVAHDIKMTKDGMKFKVKINNKDVCFTTKLLGIPNIYNILAGIALGNYLGLSDKDLINGVNSVKSVEHRLELKKYGDVTYIDDAYNSNPDGAKMALEVLSLIGGKRIVMTPGMIELGDKQNYYNKEFGKQISHNCDIVILVGEKQTKPIYDGLIESGFEKKNIYIIDDVRKGFEIVNNIKDSNTTLLAENDLPDLFN